MLLHTETREAIYYTSCIATTTTPNSEIKSLKQQCNKQPVKLYLSARNRTRTK